MKKSFCIGFILVLFSALFTLSSVSAETCSTCHDLEISNLLKSQTIFGPDFMGVDATTYETSHQNYQEEQTNILAGKTSGFITPFHMATLSDKPILYEQTEYLEEPGNPLTDEESIFKVQMVTSIKHE